MEDQVNPLERDYFLSVVLPGGTEKNATVHGSKPVMDLLVTLCATYHLNPSDYTVEVLSPNKNNISFKPNSPIGSLDADKIVLKPRLVEEKTRRPYMPEVTVRLLINYNRSHKAVVRVNPRVPLDVLLPVVCDKCEFQVESTVLLRDFQSKEPLDLTKTLNEHGLREVFAKDTACKDPAEYGHQPKTPEAELIAPPTLTQDLPKKEKKQKENAGFLSLFRRKKKKPEMGEAVSAPTSPGLNKQLAVSVNERDVCSSNTLQQADMPKKRRAPQPPMVASQSVPNNLSTCHLRGPQRSAESTLRSTKRRAPPPPCANTQLELQPNTGITGAADFVNTVEERRESDESDSVHLSVSASSSPHPSQTRSSSSSSRPSLDPYLPSFRGRDLSDARGALAKVLTSSVSKGTLVKRLKNSATFPKLYSGSFLSVSQRCPDNGGLRAELESVINSDLPTEPEWEDPLQRKGTTTFKVVPQKRHTHHDPDATGEAPDQYRVTVDVPDQYQVTEDVQDQCQVPDQCEVAVDVPEHCKVTADVPDQCQVPDQYQVTEDVQDQGQDTLDVPDQYQVPDQCEVAVDVPDQFEVTVDVPDQGQDTLDVPDQCEVTVDTPDQCQATPDVPEQGQVPDQCQVHLDVSDECQVTLDVPDQCQVPADVPDQCQVRIEDNPERTDLLETEEDTYPPDRSDAETLLCQESEAPDSPPLSHDLGRQERTGSPLSEVEDTREEKEEEEGEDEPGDTNDVASTGQIKSEDQSELLQSPSEQPVSTDTEEKEVIQEEEGEEDDDEESFPPPPPPVFFTEDMEVMEDSLTNEISHYHQAELTSAATSDPPLPPAAAAAPTLRDRMTAGPSRFAQAVAMAVQRTRLQSRGKAFSPQAPSGPQETLPSPPMSTYQYGA